MKRVRVTEAFFTTGGQSFKKLREYNMSDALAQSCIENGRGESAEPMDILSQYLYDNDTGLLVNKHTPPELIEVAKNFGVVIFTAGEEEQARFDEAIAEKQRVADAKAAAVKKEKEAEKRRQKQVEEDAITHDKARQEAQRNTGAQAQNAGHQPVAG